MRGLDTESCALDLLMEEDAAVNIVCFNQSEENLRQLITHPLCSVITDGFYVKGKAHPRLYGTYPELMGTLVRERRWLTLSEALHKSTGKAGGAIKSSGSRSFAPGKVRIWWFSIRRDRSPATYDDPNREPRGIVHVIKNGVFA